MRCEKLSPNNMSNELAHPFPASVDSSQGINSWIDLQNIPPKSPLELIARAEIDAVVGSFLYSDSFHQPSSGYSWAGSSNITFANAPICNALGTDNLENVANSDQWNFQHLTRNSDPNLAPPLAKFMFLRAGTKWRMDIDLTLGEQYDDLQLSFINNAATRGDYQGTVPVISWPNGAAAGTSTLKVTLNYLICEVTMGLRGLRAGNNADMLEMIWVIVL